MRFSFSRRSPMRTGMSSKGYRVIDKNLSIAALNRQSQTHCPTTSGSIRTERRRAVEVDRLFCEAEADARARRGAGLPSRVGTDPATQHQAALRHRHLKAS